MTTQYTLFFSELSTQHAKYLASTAVTAHRALPISGQWQRACGKIINCSKRFHPAGDVIVNLCFFATSCLLSVNAISVAMNFALD